MNILSTPPHGAWKEMTFLINDLDGWMGAIGQMNEWMNGWIEG